MRLSLAAPEHQEQNGISEKTWHSLRTLAHSMMVHARVAEEYSHHALMYAAHHVFPVLPIKDLVNEQGEPCTPFELMHGENPPVRQLRTLFCPVIVKKHTAMKDKKVVNMRNQAQKGYRGVFVGMPENQEG